ncbi:MAG: hypothetical protein ACE149_17905 [Armatimonadota bacterium]
MITEPSATATIEPSDTKVSVLITISTPGVETAICRLGNSEEVVRGLTVRELVRRIVSPNSLFSVGVPISQLQAESAAALAIGELIKADSCQVVTPGRAGLPDQAVALEEQARAVAREQTGTQGNRFLNINLEIRSAADATAPEGDDRRHLAPPPVAEVESSLTKPVLPPATFVPEWSPGYAARPLDPSPSADDAAAISELIAEEPADDQAVDAAASGEGDDQGESIGPLSIPAVAPPTTTDGILTIVAEKPVDEPKAEPQERKEYVRKSDWLRAQFLPEVEALDFSGLFVGNLGIGVREERSRRNVVLADPARITEVLLRANGYRRSGDHAKALICYQELVDMDASNADFRFLLGKSMVALGQTEEAAQAFLRAKELGHDGADKELSELKRTGHRPRPTLGFLRFWKQ